MRWGRTLAAAALSVLLAGPALAQTSPLTHGSTATAATARDESGLVDINSASTQDLDRLPGIGRKRAQAIIAHRPYRTKEDLAQRKIVPQNVYNEIQDRIVARQGSAGGSSGSSTPPHATKHK